MTDEQLKTEISAITEGLPGLDTISALERLGGNPTTYISFINRFYDEYFESSKKLSEFLAGNDLAEAHRLVHSIKSLAGNLGAEDLYRRSVSLEADMQRGRAVPSYREVEYFTDELSLVLSELNAFFLARGYMK